jgi:flagellar basal-body rod protein FlgG
VRSALRREANLPEGAYVGLGVRTAAIRHLHQQGSLTQTTNKLDLAINGRGWFQITGPEGETFYTRDGAFNKNDQGQIVTLDGYEVQPAMTVPQDATDIMVNETGEIYVTIPGQNEPQLLGQLTLASFVNDAGLEPMGGNLYRQTEASGDPIPGVPLDPGFGKIHQGYLENSNVDAVKEITELINAQRAYEMNSKVIQTVDAMYGTVANNMR